MSNPRTPEFFPKMKTRGNKRRWERRFVAYWTEEYPCLCMSIDRAAQGVRTMALAAQDVRDAVAKLTAA